jgi:hypothetical protein
MHPRHGQRWWRVGGRRPRRPPAAFVGGSLCLRLLVPPTPHQQGREAGRSRSETASVQSPSRDETRGGWHRGAAIVVAPAGSRTARRDHVAFPISSLQAQPAPASSASTSLPPEARRHSALPDRTRRGTKRSVHTAGPRTFHSAGPSVGALGARPKPSSLVRLLRLDSNRRMVGHDPFGRRSNPWRPSRCFRCSGTSGDPLLF